MTKLNLGSGTVLLPGFINIDVCKEADVQHDLTKPLPYANNSVDYIYSEHFIEHITYDQAVALMGECYRVLKAGGAIRIATPDLNFIANKYFSPDWDKQKWLEHPEYKAAITTRCRMINISFYGWGHKFVYNGHELAMILETNNFTEIKRVQKNKSKYKEFKNLETREDSLIMEAVK